MTWNVLRRNTIAEIVLLLIMTLLERLLEIMSECFLPWLAMEMLDISCGCGRVVLCVNVVCVAFAGHNLPDVSYHLYFFVLLILSISVKCSVHLCWLNKSLKWTRLMFHILVYECWLLHSICVYSIWFFSYGKGYLNI